MLGCCGVTGLKDHFRVSDAWTIISCRHGDAVWLHLELQDAAVRRVDDEIHLRFVDSDTAAPGELWIRSQTDQGTLDVAGGFSALCEVTCLDRVAQDESRPLGNDVFEKMTGTVAA